MEHQSEVRNMCLTEYDEAETMQMFKEEGREEGREEGLAEGEAERRELKITIEALQDEITRLRTQMAESGVVIEQ